MKVDGGSVSTVRNYCERILDLLGDGVYISDREGRTLAVNDMYERLTGLKKADLVGQHVDVLVRQGFDTVINPQIVQSGKPATSVQTDGRGNKRVLNGYPILNADGQVDLVVTFVRDVTLMAQLKDQLAAQRRLIERYRTSQRYINQERDKKHPIISENQMMTDLLARLQSVAASDATILLQGETGVGKDVFARRVHQMSPRFEKPFFKVDCPTIPETLIESELFGYAPGAFSGANAKGKIGFFEMADHGTLFLDEIGELPLSMQSKLLRVLQDSEIMRVGATKVRPVDVRIVAATNRNLEEDVQAGRFRSDLYYRLRVAVLTIPPLRERREDIPPLARCFLDRYNIRYKKDVQLSRATEEVFNGYRWPGNVRELENLVQSLVISSEADLVEPCDLPSAMVGNLANTCRGATLEALAKVPACDGGQTEAALNLYRVLCGGEKSLKQIVEDFECAILRDALAVHGSVSEVARHLGVDRSTLFRKLRRGRKETFSPG